MSQPLRQRESKTPAKTVTTASLDVNADNKVVQAWGKTFDYSKAVNVKATAYSADPSENEDGVQSIISGMTLNWVRLQLIQV